MTTETTIKFYALDAATAEAELGLVSFDPDHKFLLVEFWVEADQYDISGGFKTRAALEAELADEVYEWY